jgi:hypothetical protein
VTTPETSGGRAGPCREQLSNASFSKWGLNYEQVAVTLTENNINTRIPVSRFVFHEYLRKTRIWRLVQQQQQQ